MIEKALFITKKICLNDCGRVCVHGLCRRRRIVSPSLIEGTYAHVFAAIVVLAIFLLCFLVQREKAMQTNVPCAHTYAEKAAVQKGHDSMLLHLDNLPSHLSTRLSTPEQSPHLLTADFTKAT